MFQSIFTSGLLAAVLCLSTASGHTHCKRGLTPNGDSFAKLNHQAVYTRPAPVPLVTVKKNDVVIATNTTSPVAVNVPAAGVIAATVDSTVLVLARDSASAYSGFSGLNDRGIPYQVLVVPQAGVVLPALNSSNTHGNYGAIVVLSEVSYNYGTTGYGSALTTAQWQALYNYQVSFGVRMVRLDVNPGPETGTKSLGGCCTGEQYVYISNASTFLQAGLNVGAGISTIGLYHYPAKITNASMAVEVAQFAAAAVKSDNQTTASTAAVINTFPGRQQMVFFMPFSTDWNMASTFLQHAWITWATRGLYAGYRRVQLNTQVDDMFLETPIYDNDGTNYRIGTADLAHHITVMKNINAKLNPGSNWIIETGHNGNGNIETSDNLDTSNTVYPNRICGVGPVEYPDQIDTPLEYQKPIGSGKSLYPATPTLYPNYTAACMQKDSLLKWWQISTNLNAFAHLSHTFTHEDEDNSTYTDVYKEITWNQQWLSDAGINKAKVFSTGIIPPAITGLHNGDALRAWTDAGIPYVVGDNTRPSLLNQQNEHWPLISTVAANGYAGVQINPRWATNIYYNCDLPDCTVLEYKTTSNVTTAVTIYSLLTLEAETNIRHLLALHHDPFMFHQANLRYTGADEYIINGVTAQMSLLEAWTTVVTEEFTRLVNWPMITYKHDDMGKSFKDRMMRDSCKYGITWNVDSTGKTISSLSVTSNGNVCGSAIPVTFPGPVTDTQGFTTEQIGNDPLTVWVTLTGSPVTFTLKTPITV